MLEPLFAIAEDLNRRFPEGNEPFQMLKRLLEEGGELAQQVNHFEGSGLKRAKYGEPDKTKMAKEVMDVIRVALQISLYYDIQTEVEELFGKAYERSRKKDS